MQSPKFPIKQSDIKEVINVSRLKSRWKEKVRDAMRTQPIPDPVEHLDFHITLDGSCTSIAADVCSGTYIPHTPIRLLAEKSKGLCRQLVIPTVKDALILQTLSDALWGELKTKAPSSKAYYAPNDHGFSKQIHGVTDEYGPIKVWLKFQETIFNFTKTYKYIVVTDIANYYDFISYDHLRHILADLSIAREHSLDLLIFTLSHMLWQPDYMPRVQIGLPQMNLDGARLLAHCFLFDIDKLLESTPFVDFTRYMDDIDIGVDTISAAKQVLRDLDLALQTRQIRLNSGKTKILDEEKALRHFCIRENALLDSFELHIERRRKLMLSTRFSKMMLTKSISVGLDRSLFAEGNGEKILKRCINFARGYHAEITNKDVSKVMFLWPTSRETMLRWWQHSDQPINGPALISDFVSSGEIVDDITYIYIATALVNANLPASVMTDMLIKEICDHFDSKKKWGLYASLWIYSKYGTDSQLLRLIDKHHNIWSTTEPLSRLVAGLYPRMINTNSFTTFEAIVKKLTNPWLRTVSDFHKSLSTKVEGYTSVAKFIEAQNPSLPNKISHSKFLMLLSLSYNQEIAPTAISKLKAIHSFALKDSYYALLLG
jgi:hypothetical protein